jgi:hypothetical protein
VPCASSLKRYLLFYGGDIVSQSTHYHSSDSFCCSLAITLQFSASDPGFTLSAFGHSMLFAHNLSQNGTEEQKQKYLPDAVQGVQHTFEYIYSYIIRNI